MAICPRMDQPTGTPVRISLGRFQTLHPEGQRLITGWFERAWLDKDCKPADSFEPFIYAWFAVNGWAACVSEVDQDSRFIRALSHDQTLSEGFNRLIADPKSAFAEHARAFYELWPIFEVKELRRRRLLRIMSGDRPKIVQAYLAAGAENFKPDCWKRHRDAGEAVPLDWCHTLNAIYRVRCNLFHGEKAAHSEMDQQVVFSSFQTLVHFFRLAGHL